MSKPAKIAATAKPPGTSPAAELDEPPVELAELEPPVEEPEPGPEVLVPFLEPPELPVPLVAFPVGAPVGAAVREAAAELGKLLPQRVLAAAIASIFFAVINFLQA